MPSLPPLLIAEDSDDDFFFFRRAARAAAIENPILRFRDGSELVAFIGRNDLLPSSPPMLLFVDLSMPVMNGFEVLEWLRRRDHHPFMPIVLSGSRRDEDIKRAYELGAEEFVVKPLSPMLLAAIAMRPAVAA